MEQNYAVSPQGSYCDSLVQSYEKVGNNICLGIDPQWKKLPQAYRKTLGVRFISPDTKALQEFLEISFGQLLDCGLSPSAFKPNIGYFQSLDRPLLCISDSPEEQQRAFAGSMLLAWLYQFLSQKFPAIPIILDFKKGDIARSSANYAEEGFVCWASDALTINPYMGSDSALPFGLGLQRHLRDNAFEPSATSAFGQSLSCQLPYGFGGVYSLLRTSNLGGRDLQNLELRTLTFDKEAESQPLYMSLANTLLQWRKELQIPGLGAVVGATSVHEFSQIAQLYADQEFPLLIPGVGKQGGSFFDVQKTLKDVGYPLQLARINLSSGLLQSWDGDETPADWSQLISRRMEELL